MNHLIVDGFSLAYSSQFAFSDARTSSGTPSGCVYGFLNRLSPWKKRFQNFHVTVAWDSGSTRKKEAFGEYKSERPKSFFGDQITDLKAALQCLNVTQASCPGEEADDVIAALVKTYEKEGQTYIFTSDKDLTQLVVDGRVIMIRPSSGANSEIFFDEAAVKEKMGVYPKDVACFLAFRGDTIDSIPGLSRVRSTIISRIVEKYRTPENVYANLKDEKLTDFERKSFEDFEQQAKINITLTSLAPDLSLSVVKGSSDSNKLASYLDKYEIKRIASESYTKVFNDDSSFHIRTDLPSLFDE